MDIKAFLQPPVVEETKEVIISNRFKGADGKPAPFKIKRITQEMNERLSRRATTTGKGINPVGTFDSSKYGKLLISACVVEPDFSNAELCEFYKTTDPLDVPGIMLLPGEYAALMEEINNFNGFNEDRIEEDRETAKK